MCSWRVRWATTSSPGRRACGTHLLAKHAMLLCANASAPSECLPDEQLATMQPVLRSLLDAFQGGGDVRRHPEQLLRALPPRAHAAALQALAHSYHDPVSIPLGDAQFCARLSYLAPQLPGVRALTVRFHKALADEGMATALAQRACSLAAFPNARAAGMYFVHDVSVDHAAIARLVAAVQVMRQWLSGACIWVQDVCAGAALTLARALRAQGLAANHFSTGTVPESGTRLDCMYEVALAGAQPRATCKLRLQDIVVSERDDVAHIMCLLASPRRVERLRLMLQSPGACAAQLSGLQQVAAALTIMRSLERLDLSHSSLTDARGIAALADAMQNLISLHVLDLEHCSLDSSRFAAIARGLSKMQRHLTQFASLDLSGNSAGADGARALARAIPELSMLQVLHITDCGFGLGGAQELAQAMRACSKLLCVRVGDRISSGEAQTAGALSAWDSLLTQPPQALCNLIVGDSHALVGGNILPSGSIHLSSLLNLQLGNSKLLMTSSDAHATAQQFAERMRIVFEGAPQLDYVDLSSTGLTAEAVRQLVPVLKHARNLSSVNIAHNALCESSLAELAGWAQDSDRYITAPFAGNCVGMFRAGQHAEVALGHPDVICADFQMLEPQQAQLLEGPPESITSLLLGWTSLLRLHVSGHRLQGAAMHALAAALTSGHSLRALRLEGCGIDDASAMLLAPAISAPPRAARAQPRG